VNHHVTVVEHDPSTGRIAFDLSFLLVVLADGFVHALGERVEHTVAGAVADDEVIGERSYILDVDQQDVFAFFIFQGIDDGAGKFESFQVSPHG